MGFVLMTTFMGILAGMYPTLKGSQVRHSLVCSRHIAELSGTHNLNHFFLHLRVLSHAFAIIMEL